MDKCLKNIENLKKELYNTLNKLPKTKQKYIKFEEIYLNKLHLYEIDILNHIKKNISLNNDFNITINNDTIIVKIKRYIHDIKDIIIFNESENSNNYLTKLSWIYTTPKIKIKSYNINKNDSFILDYYTIVGYLTNEIKNLNNSDIFIKIKKNVENLRGDLHNLIQTNDEIINLKNMINNIEKDIYRLKLFDTIQENSTFTIKNDKINNYDPHIIIVEKITEKCVYCCYSYIGTTPYTTDPKRIEKTAFFNMVYNNYTPDLNTERLLKLYDILK